MTQAQENESNAQAAQGGADPYFGFAHFAVGFGEVRSQWNVALILNPKVRKGCRAADVCNPGLNSEVRLKALDRFGLH